MSATTFDPYIDAACGVLRNRLGIVEVGELEVVEAELAEIRDLELVRTPLGGTFDLAHLRRIHQRLFGDVYDWAGEVRTVGIDKGVPFALPQYIAPMADELFRQLAAEKYLRELARGSFVERLGFYLAEVNALHPFREGNGRAQRAFFRQLSAEAGWHLDWTDVSREENIEASRRSLAGDLGPLVRLLDRIVVPLAQ